MAISYEEFKKNLKTSSSVDKQSSRNFSLFYDKP